MDPKLITLGLVKNYGEIFTLSQYIMLRILKEKKEKNI